MANQNERIRGYRRLAELMTWDPTLAIFPRFQVVNLRNLLLMQAEISELEEELNDAIRDDEISDGDARNFCCDWSFLKKAGPESKQYQVSQNLRCKLAEYNQALAHQILVNKQDHPQPHDLDFLQRWLTDIQGGSSELRGPGSLTWLPQELGGRSNLDLVTVASVRERSDTFSIFLRRHAASLLARMPSWLVSKRCFPLHEGGSPLVFYGNPDSNYSFGDKLMSFVATIFILVPVIVLHFLQSADARLIVIVLFTLGFTAMLVWGTTAERPQVFAATAAFVAVQVVYIGAALNGTS